MLARVAAGERLEAWVFHLTLKASTLLRNASRSFGAHVVNAITWALVYY